MNSLNYLKPNLTAGVKSVGRYSVAVGIEFLAMLLWIVTLGLPVQAALGVSYDKINATTKADLTAQNSKVQEELWARNIVEGADFQYAFNPFADGMMGGLGLGKAICRIADTTKVAGQVVNIPTMGGAGGPALVGDGDRLGKEQKFQIGNFPVQIDVCWFGFGWKATARDQTVLGRRNIDALVTKALKQQHAKKRSDDILMKLRVAAGTGATGRNLILPTGVASRNLLRSANVLSTPMIAQGKNSLTSLGALPMELGTGDSGGSLTSRYMLLATQHALQNLDTEPAYLEALIHAGVQGEKNPVFRGEYTEWNSTGIYRWNMIDHCNWGPVGSPLCPRAFLGVAIVGATTGTEVKGGGTALAAASLPAPNFFEFFSNAPYSFHDGTTIAAVTNVDRYIMIINPDGSYGVFNYRVNDGNKITLFTAPTVSIGQGTETTSFVEGALIVECNSAGVPFGRSLFFGQEMVCAGIGSIDGTPTSVGQRTSEIRNHSMDIGVGVQAVWGCSVTRRSDNQYPGFVMAEHALTVNGAPVIQ